MRILILNWRDLKNPDSGGAEILTHEIAKRWVKMGHKVTQFSSLFNNAKEEENLDGVKIIRRGYPDARYLLGSVHFWAFRYYLSHFRGKFDAVIDEIHGLPFFTPWYVREKKVALICEVAGEIWWKMFGPLFGLIGRLTEIFYLRTVYKRIPYLTISESTKEDLVKSGVKRENITVLPMGISMPRDIKTFDKEKDTTLIFVGRLSKSKGIEDAIIALRKVSKKIPKVKLWVVGRGKKEYVDHLESLAKKLNVFEKITFFGYVAEPKKFELMSRSHILLAPSMKEGWGLIVPEAGLMGTPVVGYNVKGLKEVILDKKTGYLTLNNSPKELANSIEKVLKDKLKYQKISAAAKKLSSSYNWDNTAEVALEVLKEKL